MYSNTADVAGVRIFYREAGDPSKPTIVLLHGFPCRRHSSATSFRFWRIGFMLSHPTMRRPDICRSDWISLENRFPAPA